jgi:tetratricopeptide (TPR) repeat protein
MDRLEAKHENFRAGLTWAIETGTRTGEREAAEIGLRTAGALWWFWSVRGHLAEGSRWLMALLALPGAAPRTAARAKALNRAGALALWQEGHPTAEPLLLEALSIRQELGERLGLTGPLNNLGHLAITQGDAQRARALFEECAAIYQEHDDAWGVAMALANAGNAAHHEGDHAAARAFHEESLARMRTLGDWWAIAYSLNWLGDLALSHCDYDAAATYLAESLALWQRIGARVGIATCLGGLAQVALARGRAERAARLFAAAQSLRQALGTPPTLGVPDGLERTRAALDHDAFAAAWAEGKAMPTETAIAYALELMDVHRTQSPF